MPRLSSTLPPAAPQGKTALVGLARCQSRGGKAPGLLPKRRALGDVQYKRAT
jgi:hypothetical protein